MNAVNAVQLFILVWTFSVVCQADQFDFSISCDDVTGYVEKEVTFTCNITQQCTKYCVTNYKFQYKDSTICKHEFPVGSCDQRISFTCSFTPTTNMTEQFRFFLQTNCGMKTTKFTVSITGMPSLDMSLKADNPGSKDTSSKHAAISASVGCFSIVLIIIILIIMTLVWKTKPNFTKPHGFQKRMFLCIRHDEDNTSPPEDVI